MNVIDSGVAGGTKKTTSTSSNSNSHYRYARGNTVYDYHSNPVGTTQGIYHPSGSTSSGSGYGSGSGSYSGGGESYSAPAQNNSYMEALMAALEAQRAARQQAIDAANSALDQMGNNARDRYNSSRGQIGSDYQDLRNQAAVQNFKAKRSQREALADRGALNTGAGMQENLKLSSNYNNNMNKINTQEQSAYETLLNNLNSYLAQIESQKAANMASGLNDYNNTISSLINATFSGYQPSEGYLNLAQSLAGGNGALNNVVQSNNAIGNSLYDTLLRAYGVM